MTGEVTSDLGSDGIQDPITKITEASNGIQNLLSIFTMGSDWIMDPILHLVERSSGIIDPTLGFTDMSGQDQPQPETFMGEVSDLDAGVDVNFTDIFRSHLSHSKQTTPFQNENLSLRTTILRFLSVRCSAAAVAVSSRSPPCGWSSGSSS